MVYINPSNVLTLLTVMFADFHFEPSEVTNQEKDLANGIFNILLASMNDKHLTIDEEVTLEVDSSADTSYAYAVDSFGDDDEPASYDYDVYEEVAGASTMCTHMNADRSTCDDGSIDMTYKTDAVAYWKSGKKRKLSLERVQHRFRKVKSERQLYRWDEQISQGGDRRSKLRKLSEHVLLMFKNARTRGMIIHDHDLKRWAQEAQDSLCIPNFEASYKWVQKFKLRHNISSRKITKYKSKIAVQNEVVVKHKAEAFVAEVRKLIPEYGLQNILNTDQSGFALELHSGRTLAETGTKKIETVVQSVSATTHSYTIQPIISAAGQLLSPLLIVLKEPTGQLGPRVQASMFRPENVFIMTSKSGKLTKYHVQTWFTEIFLPNTGSKSILILDSWGGQTATTIESLIPATKTVKIMTIPEGATGYIQPLDVYGFRLWKQFVRQFSDTVLLSQYDCNLHLRDNIVKLQSLTHNQFSSPRYRELFKYSWYKSGYVDEQPEQFTTPVQFSFTSATDFRCDVCGEIAIIRCSWCKKPLCFKHFFTEYHYCSTYEP